jgi:hypothetical protein
MHLPLAPVCEVRVRRDAIGKRGRSAHTAMPLPLQRELEQNPRFQQPAELSAPDAPPGSCSYFRTNTFDFDSDAEHGRERNRLGKRAARLSLKGEVRRQPRRARVVTALA